jgi:hypothetical protein
MKLPNIEENWNSEEAEQLILSGLNA